MIKNKKNNIKLVSTVKKHSFFEFINKYCLGEKSGLSHNSAFHRLCSLMRKMDVKTIIIESIPNLYDEIKDECSALNSYYGKINIKAYRITFLAKEISTLVAVSSLKDNDFLSSSIIINYKNSREGWKSYLFSAIVTIPKIKNNQKFAEIPLLNNYLQIFKTFKREVFISQDTKFEYKITGSFFCQQNSITSVCAHASLCMILNNMHLSAKIITPEDINRIIGVTHQEVKSGEKIIIEFTNKEIEMVLNKYGLNYELLDFFENPNIEYNDYIYKYIESNCPVLLQFRTDISTSHVVPILGHTLNSDMWRPEAETAYSYLNQWDFLSSSAWVDHFIIHDDNFGMYFCLPVDTLKRITLPKYDPNFRAYYAIVIKPLDIKTSFREAEASCLVIVSKLLKWCKNKNVTLDVWTDLVADRILKNGSIVRRTFLTTKENYIRSLEEKDFENNSFSQNDKIALSKDLPDRFWLSEITLPELYTANRSKIIDFFYGCNYPNLPKKDEITQRCLQIRFPFGLLKQDKTIFSMSVKSHYPLFRLKNEYNSLDW